jgi:outer membrane lipoprotein-sorting protein
MFKINFLCVLCVLLLPASVFSQPARPGNKPPSSVVTSAESNDPKAKALLDKLRKRYESFKSVELNFALTIELPERPKEVQNGKLIQQGNMFQLILDKQHVFCDGRTVWMYSKPDNEVQLSDFKAGATGGLMSPQDLIKLYQSGDYIYAVNGSGAEAGKSVEYVEFKPVKRSSPYTKVRLAVDSKNQQIVSLRVFARDGSRYSMVVGSLVSNKVYETTLFSFNKAKYPGVRVEDLRED